MTVPHAVGIDLGTTNSAAAWIDPAGRTAMIPNAEGEMLTPSVVLFDRGEVVVGREARRAAPFEYERVAQWVKRDMGAPVYSRTIGGERLPPEVIQSCILRRLRSDVLRVVGPDHRAAVTVPAYFDEPRRKATADAAEMAALAMLDIVSEPTAAALAFGERLGYLGPDRTAREPMTLLVYDLGGGTFDATVLRLAPAEFRTLATDGDVHLGGHDWDTRLVDYVAETFAAAHGTDPRQDPAALGRLFEAVEEAKHSLTVRRSAAVRIEYAGSSLELSIDRGAFEELTADLLERTAATCRQLLAAAGVGWDDIDRVLLVGGATRMPMVQAMLQRLWGRPPDHSVNPDEAVARGAALYARYLLGLPQHGGPGAEVAVTNVNAHSLGVEGIDPATGRKTNVVLIPKNTPLPARRTQRFTTKEEGQRSIVVQVLEGENPQAEACTPIGRTILSDLPEQLPKGSPVLVTFRYDIGGRLGVHAAVPGTAREVGLELERPGGLSAASLTRWGKAVESERGLDAFEAALQEVLSEAHDGEGGLASDDDPVAALASGGEGSPAAGYRAQPSPARRVLPETAATAEPRPPGREDVAVEKAAPVGPPASGQPPRGVRLVIQLTGLAVSAAVGLTLGYLVLSWLRPQAFPLPW